METIQFGLALEYDTGRHCTTATNGKVVVEVHCSEASDPMWYHIGEINEANVIWKESIRFGSGYKPAIAINNNGLVVEVHETSNVVNKKVYGNVGQLNGNKIDWHTNQSFDSGLHPDVALNDHNMVVEIHETSNVTKKSLYCNIGEVKGDHIDWGSSQKCPHDGFKPSIAIDNKGNVIAVYERSSSLYYMLGELSGKKINWLTTEQKYQSGKNPSVSLTDDGRIVEVHESQGLTGLWQMSGKTTSNHSIDWSEASHFDSGSSPKVSTASDGTYSIQVHTGSLFKLWYSSAKLMDSANFMSKMLPEIGALPLHKMVLPASHDAGMYLGGSSLLGKTQSFNLYQQLTAGSRYYDLRPNRNLDIYHGPITGPSLEVILKDIQQFFNEGHRELAILKFSHFSKFNATIYKEMLAMIKTYLDPWIYKTKPTGSDRLADLSMDNYIGSRGSILILIDENWAIENPEDGFWVYRDWSAKDPEKGDLTVFDQYSNTTSFDKMKDDQLTKLNDFNGKCEHNPSVPCDLFLLSWTLTPITGVATYSQKANRQLGRVMSTQKPNSKGFFANLLYLDYFEAARPTWISSILIERYNGL